MEGFADMIRTVETASSLVLLLCSKTPSAQFKGLEGTRTSLNNNELSSKSVGLLHNNFPLILFLEKKSFSLNVFRHKAITFFIFPAKNVSGLAYIVIISLYILKTLKKTKQNYE